MTYIKKNIPSGPDAFDANYYINQFKEKYGERYKYFPEDFDKREIGTRNRDLKIRIECSHGIKEVQVRRHLDGYECRYCKGTMIDKTIAKIKQMELPQKERKKLSIICNRNRGVHEFIKLAQKTHGQRYSYDKFVYVNAKIKGIITCPIHGDFEQNPDSHINAGSGCNRCGSAGTYNEWYFNTFPEMKDIPATLYIVKMHDDCEEFIKIGITKRNHTNRMAQIKHASEYKVEEILLINTTLYNAWSKEQMLLSQYKEYKYEPLKYFPGHTECLLISNEAAILRGIL